MNIADGINLSDHIRVEPEDFGRIMNVSLQYKDFSKSYRFECFKYDEELELNYDYLPDKMITDLIKHAKNKLIDAFNHNYRLAH